MDDLLRDGKPQPCAFLILAAGQIRLVKTVEDQIQAVLRDADAWGDRERFSVSFLV